MQFQTAVEPQPDGEIPKKSRFFLGWRPLTTLNHDNLSPGGDKCLHGCDGEPNSTAWLHRRADWEDWAGIHSHLLCRQHLAGPHHRQTEAQDESDHHHPPPCLHRQLHLVDADVLAWQSGKHPTKDVDIMSSIINQCSN